MTNRVRVPCNRPWEEYEVTAISQAKDKFWADIGGSSQGDDPVGVTDGFTLFECNL